MLLGGEASVPLSPGTRVWLVALGKASPAMARAAIEILDPLLRGGVVAYPSGSDPGTDWPDRVAVMAGGHPLPDEGSLRSGQAVISLLRDVKPEDIVLVLLSGGGSAVAESLTAGMSLDRLRELTQDLQRSGADITELNTVRRSLSLLKGGGLARLARPASTLTLILSDVVGDPLEAIASGPTVPSSTGPTDALAVLDRYGLLESHASTARVLRERTSAIPDPLDPARLHSVIIGSNLLALRAVQRKARVLGFRSRILTSHLSGESRHVGKVIGGMARSVRSHALPFPPPACLILGGETTVTVQGSGRGGRNQELALGAALVLDGCERAAILSFATDGVDGASHAAGAVVTGETLARARSLGLSPAEKLAENDSEAFFEPLGDLWITGPTGTNVNDLAIVLVYP